MGVLDLAPMHSKHANMTYQQLLHLHCIQSKLLAKATELSLAQGVNLLHSPQDCLQASKLRWVWFSHCPRSIKLLLLPFYPHVISFTRPSPRLIFRVKGRQRERKAWERGYIPVAILLLERTFSQILEEHFMSCDCN